MKYGVIKPHLWIFVFLSLAFVVGRIMIYLANEKLPYSYEFIVHLIQTGFVAISAFLGLWALCWIFKSEKWARLSVWLLGFSVAFFYLKFFWATWHSSNFERLVGLSESHVIFLVDSATLSLVYLIAILLWLSFIKRSRRSRGDKEP